MGKWLISSDRGDFTRGGVLDLHGVFTDGRTTRGHFDFTPCPDKAAKYGSEQEALEAIKLMAEEGETLRAIPMPSTSEILVRCQGIPFSYFCYECGKSGVKLWRKRGTKPTKDRKCWRCLGAVSKEHKQTHRIEEVFYDCDISAREISCVSRFIRLLWWESLPL